MKGPPIILLAHPLSPGRAPESDNPQPFIIPEDTTRILLLLEILYNILIARLISE